MTNLSGANLNNGAAVGPQGEGMESPSTFPAYRAYKDSRVEWLDTLPAHWEKVALKWVSRIFAGGTPDKTKTHYWENGSIPWLNSGAVNQVLISEPSAFITTEAFNSSSTRWIPSGSLVMALAGQGKTKGMVAQLAIRTTCNQSMAAITPAGNVKPRYLFWWLSNNYQNIRNMAGGDLRDGLNLELIGDIPALMPSEEEQTQIARFLDHETVRIDALIEEQQRLIELLKEKRQAVISHAVTKGLDPAVPMKDSGVEWLGEVPAHWEVKKVKHFGRVTGGFAFKSTEFTSEGHPVLKISNVGHLCFEWGDQSYLPDEFRESHSEFIAPKGALVFAMTRPVIAGGIKVARLEDDSLPLVNQRVGFMVVHDVDLSRYLLLSTQSDPFLNQFKNNLTITNQPNISSEGIESISIAVPPLIDMKNILAFCQKFDAAVQGLIGDALRGTELLQERRSALISAAVTGKIDVRGWQPPASAPTPELAQEAV